MGSRTAETFFETLLHSLIDDFNNINSRDSDRDKTYITKRVKHEGIKFITVTLPKISKALETALETGSFIAPTSFGRSNNTALPHLFKGLLQLIFTKSGFLRPDADVEAIYAIRQICSIGYKTNFAFSDEQLASAEIKFKTVDESLPELGDILTVPSLSQRVLYRAQKLVSIVFEHFDISDITPGFGPGISAGGEKPHQKPLLSVHYEAIHNEYPYYRFFTPNTDLLRYTPDYWSRERRKVGRNKVLFVPKDSRGPRTIACEPVEYMWIQQGIRKKLYDHLEAHPLTRASIKFTDQTFNQRAAYAASSHKRHLATVDLQDASDSVSEQLVDFLTQNCAKVNRALLATRTPHSLLPSGEVVVLKKFAAMGSALCFPIEALVFWSLSAALIHETGTNSVSKLKDLDELLVYGDDIVINSQYLNDLTSIFKDLGLKINTGKSFFKGAFRESCGKDYYNGIDITTVKVRNIDINSDQGICSLVETANLLRNAFLHRAAQTVENYIPISLPNGLPDSPYLCYSSPRHVKYVEEIHSHIKNKRWNNHLQFYERRVPYVKGSKYHFYKESDHHEYLRKITVGWGEEFESHAYAIRGAHIGWKYVQLGR